MILGNIVSFILNYIALNYLTKYYIHTRYLNGFQDIKENFKYSVHVPLNPNLSEYQIQNNDKMKAILAYKNFEYGLENLQPPVVIVCKSANRASAIYAAFKGMNILF